jgi:PhnB protein
MTRELPFDFEVDKENSQIHVSKTFNAGLGMVWDVWTKPEYLDQWWAPKPYRVETKSMHFKPDGRWHYAMISPQGEKHWCLADYQSIEDKEKYTYTDAFCDDYAEIDFSHPRTEWTVQFSALEEYNTKVNILLQYASLNDLEKIIGMGFQEGFTLAVTNLDKLLASLKSQ